ncbi:ubiquinone anaerobic biosynthesis protein UbiU [Solemya velesiana gill symbiont]|uniref:Ubiquinone biosynthesis protein UbiU n=1 Tax=Solemya velesiana gill symbiont TaxID=1918948 RepID=A0A1T2KTN2_9GAMM|nr:peptidase U32 family protein [Solemya velesiana gill symbiont]OOZ36194.1 protease [Solemya velesiana gill symbiont]
MELVCPAGNLPSLKAAVDNGADAVYFGFRDDTNARHFAGLNFGPAKMAEGIKYARQRGVKLFLALNTYPQPGNWSRWQQAVDQAADLGVDALIAADIGVLDYAAEKHPGLNLHLSVQSSATNYEALQFYMDHFGIKRAVLPRVPSLGQVKHVVESSPVEVEVFGFGSLCVMVEGRCILSSYATGRSPNTYGACSPASHVEWKETPQGLETRLGGVLIERTGKGETAGYPTFCKGSFCVGGNTYHAIEEPTSLNTLEILPQLLDAGVSAIKIEGRQRSPVYVAQVARIWRAAIDACKRDPQHYKPQADWLAELGKVSEGTQTTLGAYSRPWQ